MSLTETTEQYQTSPASKVAGETQASVPGAGGDVFGVLRHRVGVTVLRVAVVTGAICLGLVAFANLSPWAALIAWPLGLLGVFWRVIFNDQEIEPLPEYPLADTRAPLAAQAPLAAMAPAFPEPPQPPEPTWRAIIDSTTDPVMLIDRDGYVIHFNPPLADLFDKVRPGIPLTNLTRSPALLQALATLTPDERQRIVQIEDRIPVLRKLSAIVTPVSMEDDSGLKLVVLRDLTAEQQHAQQRSDFIAHASHELRTPLASLKSMVETLQGPARDDVSGRERFLAMMEAQASRMSRLIDDLLVLSRAEMRVHVPPTDRVDLAELIKSCAEQLRPLADGRGNEIIVEGFDAPIVVRGDRDDLFQIFQNLLQNAIKYGREDDEVRVTARRVVKPGRRDAVEIRVVDRGEGIAPEHLPRISERFYRVSATASRAKGGTGLGLAIVKYLLNRHKGRLDVESEVGKGSTFQVTLDAEPARPETAQ
jgi:two-component system phosphate regulon sensor histidine kinase PhoR